MKEKLKWALDVLKGSTVRVDQYELHTRLAACAEKIEEVVKELEADEADNVPK